jgi:hypothetical protein
MLLGVGKLGELDVGGLVIALLILGEAVRLHPHRSAIRTGRKGHWSSGTAPFSPANCRSLHFTEGCPGKAKMASGSVMHLLSPHTEQPSAGMGGQEAGTGAGVRTGAVVGEIPGVHPQSLATSAGSNPHWSSGTRPSVPASCNASHPTEGCPGNENMASGCVIHLPSPQTEQPSAGIEGQIPLKIGAGVGAGVGTGVGVGVGEIPA